MDFNSYMDTFCAPRQHSGSFYLSIVVGQGHKCDVMMSDSLLTLWCPSVFSVDTNTSSLFQLRPALLSTSIDRVLPTCLSNNIKPCTHAYVCVFYVFFFVQVRLFLRTGLVFSLYGVLVKCLCSFNLFNVLTVAAFTCWAWSIFLHLRHLKRR